MGSQTLNNPLAFPTITDFLAAFLNVVIVISVPIVVFYLIYAGFLYVKAMGNPAKIQEAQQALLYGVIGGVIIMSAVAMISIIESVVTGFKS